MTAKEQRSEVNEPDLEAFWAAHHAITAVHADAALTPAERYAAVAPLLEAERRALGGPAEEPELDTALDAFDAGRRWSESGVREYRALVKKLDEEKRLLQRCVDQQKSALANAWKEAADLRQGRGLGPAEAPPVEQAKAGQLGCDVCGGKAKTMHVRCAEHDVRSADLVAFELIQLRDERRRERDPIPALVAEQAEKMRDEFSKDKASVEMPPGWLGRHEPDDHGAEDLPPVKVVDQSPPWGCVHGYTMPHAETLCPHCCPLAWRSGTTYSRDEHVAALEAMEDSAMACAAHLIARWLRK